MSPTGGLWLIRRKKIDGESAKSGRVEWRTPMRPAPTSIL
jgi:hypothetical protein